MQFGTIDILVIIRSGQLEIYTDDKKIQTLQLAHTIFNFGEIIDKNLFISNIQEFIKLNIKTKKEIVVGIAPELTIQKEFAITDSVEEEKKQFIGQIPFEEVSTVELKNKKNTIIVGANYQIIAVIREICESLDIHLTSVVPLQYFIENSTQVTHENKSKILQNKQLLKELDFLKDKKTAKIEIVNQEKKDKQTSIQSVSEKKEPKKNQSLILILALLLFIGAGVLIAYAFGLIKIPNTSVIENQNVLPSPIIEETIVPSSSPEIDVIDKTAISISVLNGTATPGEAAKVKAELETIGFTRVETSNSTNTESTKISFSSKVPVVYKEEILAKLTELFSEVIQEEQGNTDFDVVITTGK